MTEARTPIWNRIWFAMLGATAVSYAVIIGYGAIGPYFA